MNGKCEDRWSDDEEEEEEDTQEEKMAKARFRKRLREIRGARVLNSLG